MLQNSVFYMAGAAQASVIVDGNTDLEAIFSKLLKIDPSDSQIPVPTAGVDSKESVASEEDLEPVERKANPTFLSSMKSSLSAMTSSALGALKNLVQTSKPVIIPTVMVSQNYGRALIAAYDLMHSKGLSPKLLITTDVKNMALDKAFTEGHDLCLCPRIVSNLKFFQVLHPVINQKLYFRAPR
jgi:hypothetical protein